MVDHVFGWIPKILGKEKTVQRNRQNSIVMGCSIIEKHEFVREMNRLLLIWLQIDI